MQTKQKRPSERFKRKVLARWRWSAARGRDLVQAALEIGVVAADLLVADAPGARAVPAGQPARRQVANRTVALSEKHLVIRAWADYR
ncbi:hypothetical protein [Nannocystis pusilla]|uniref:hypothetical protein n=1 Tax=Nannocystis pusilla TaxID=889268 RepID=UPI003DA238EE